MDVISLPELVKLGMVALMLETWLLLGRWFRLPILVRWHGNASLAEVSLPKIPLLECQIKQIRETLLVVGENRGDPNVWWVFRSHLVVIARSAEGKGAEESLIWNPDAMSAKSVRAFTGSNDRNDFIEFYSKRGLSNTRAQAAALFEDFCRKGLEWMAIRGKPWDLGFVRLYPIPYRPDWISILSSLQVGKDWRKYPKTSEALAEDGWMKSFFNPKLLSVTSTGLKKKVIRWGIGVVPTQTWHKVVLRAEQWRYDRVGIYGYYTEIKKTIQSLLPGAVKVALSYFSQTDYPAGGFFKFSRPVRTKLISFPRSGVHEPIWANHRISHIWGEDFHACCHGRGCCCGSGEHLVEEGEGVPEMPSLQPEEKDLRDVWEKVDKPPHVEGGADGVPVLHAVGEPV